VKNNSFIFEPETNELNQLCVQYAAFDTTVKLGRQKIVYGNGAFIGNVGWRQNERTYDGLSITNKSISGLTLSYSYIEQVNRVFGYDAATIFENAPGEIHLLSGSYTGIKGLTLGGYVYLMDFDEKAARKWNNDTYGVSAKGTFEDIALYAEVAYQEDTGDKNDTEAMYFHINANKTFGTQLITVGVEELDACFQTPLATNHIFNGFADATDVRRADGTRIRVMELQGPLLFSTFEPVVRELVKQGPYCQHVILNFRHVVSVDEVSLRMLHEIQQQLASSGVRLLCCQIGKFTKLLARAGLGDEALFTSEDAALESCENVVLADVMPTHVVESRSISLGECALFVKCDDEDLKLLNERMEFRTYAAGETIIQSGSDADELFVLLSGSIEVRLHSNPSGISGSTCFPAA